MKRLFAIAVLASAFCQPAFAASGDIKVTDAWTRPTPSTDAAAIYLTVENDGIYKDVLQSVRADVADKADMHLSTEEDGMMKMVPLPSVDVHPGEPEVFKPMGMHIMLAGLHHALKAGDSFPLVLHFRDSGDVTATVSVSMDKPAEDGMDHMHMKM